MADASLDLQRFVEAQESYGTYAVALTELRRGRKSSHWVWYIFPQVTGLGQSSMAQRYGVAGLAEAREYLAHPVLGPRLAECVETILGLPESDPLVVMGSGVDAMKLRSSMTLFAHAAQDVQAAQPFTAVLDKYFDGEQDPATLRRL